MMPKMSLYKCLLQISAFMHLCTPVRTAPTVGGSDLHGVESDLGLYEGELQPRAVQARWPLVGVNQCGLEYGDKHIPGQVGTDYFIPEMSSINQFFNLGHNIIRVPFLMERLLNHDRIDGNFHNVGYLREIGHLVDQITNQGKFAVIVPLNYGRFGGNIIKDLNGFGDFWRSLAGKFAKNDKVIFDIMNEWHDEPMRLVHDLLHHAIVGIRASGASSQAIWIEGACWDNAWAWNQCKGTDGISHDILANLKDPSNKLVYSIHVYMDQDDTGHWLDDCDGKEPLVGINHLRPPTAWLRKHKKVGVIGEFGARPTPNCLKATKIALNYLKKNGGLWQGVLWWNSGSHTKDQPSSIEPGTKGFDMYAKLLAS
ncbi:Endoglucanase gh5-1 [Pseudocercospora fuligena]|uniref:cellulase n=1 Tax=Pseudocercospora fuligena TaxID=685502 RepID=A0A8H6VCQ5_9PEZI|nr:Endoglucanase gh5-1 [Pseudocercospora fuligena]